MLSSLLLGLAPKCKKRHWVTSQPVILLRETLTFHIGKTVFLQHQLSGPPLIKQAQKSADGPQLFYLCLADSIVSFRRNKWLNFFTVPKLFAMENTSTNLCLLCSFHQAGECLHMNSIVWEAVDLFISGPCAKETCWAIIRGSDQKYFQQSSFCNYIDFWILWTRNNTRAWIV